MCIFLLTCSVSLLLLGGLCPSETGSESVHTDLNDEHKGIRTAARDNREGFKCDNNVVIATGCNMAPYEDFTPIYIIKNLVVKPVRCTVSHCPGPPFCNVISIFVLCRLYTSLFFIINSSRCEKSNITPVQKQAHGRRLIVGPLVLGCVGRTRSSLCSGYKLLGGWCRCGLQLSRVI